MPSRAVSKKGWDSTHEKHCRGGRKAKGRTPTLFANRLASQNFPEVFLRLSFTSRQLALGYGLSGTCWTGPWLTGCVTHVYKRN